MTDKMEGVWRGEGGGGGGWADDAPKRGREKKYGDSDGRPSVFFICVLR